jgi:hypothetical protein
MCVLHEHLFLRAITSTFHFPESHIGGDAEDRMRPPAYPPPDPRLYGAGLRRPERGRPGEESTPSPIAIASEGEAWPGKGRWGRGKGEEGVEAGSVIDPPDMFRGLDAPFHRMGLSRPAIPTTCGGDADPGRQ